jgi:uncharacterized membrane protein
MDADPRTLLPIVGVPNGLGPAFKQLQGCLLHWIGRAYKVSTTGKEVCRVVIVGDAALYVCEEDATISRCVLVANIGELGLRSTEDLLGLRVIGAHEYDLAIRFLSDRDFAFVVQALRRIYWSHMGRELGCRELENVTASLRLAKPAAFTVKIEPLRPLKYLERLIADHEADIHRHIEEAHDEFVRIKNVLKAELDIIRTTRYEQLVEELASTSTRLSNTTDALEALRAEAAKVRDHVMDTNARRSLDRALASAPQSEAVRPRSDNVCSTCEDWRALAAKDTTDLRNRIVLSESNVASLTKELELVRESVQPLRDDTAAHNATLHRVREIAGNQRHSPADRLRGICELLDHINLTASSSGQAAKHTSQNALRQLVRDLSFQHMAALSNVRQQFAAYDEALVVAVRRALEDMGRDPRAAESVVMDARDQWQLRAAAPVSLSPRQGESLLGLPTSQYAALGSLKSDSGVRTRVRWT